MRRALSLTLAAAVLAAGVAPAAVAVTPKQTAALLRLAARISGLEAKRSVKVVAEGKRAFDRRRITLLDRSYPPALQSYDESVFRALGLVSGGKGAVRAALIGMMDGQGAYDPRTRKAYVRKGPTERVTLLHELVHAVQDQHFDLRRLPALSQDRDAALAGLAAVEGHATLATDVIAGLPSRTPRITEGANLRTFLELEQGFPYATGLRFAARLRNLGGNRAVFTSLRRFPETTEQIFHLEKFLEREKALPIILPVDAAGFTLAGDNTFGELAVRALLAVYEVPRLDLVGTGWGGGRSAVYRGRDGAEAVAIALDWDTARDAAEWAEAVEIMVNEAFDASTPGLPARAACAAESCWSLGARRIAFERDGGRTALVFGPAVEDAAALARRIVGD